MTPVNGKLSSYLLSSQRFFSVHFHNLSSTLLYVVSDKHWNNVNESLKRKRKEFLSYLRYRWWILQSELPNKLVTEMQHTTTLMKKEKKYEWTFCWANELNKWKRVIKASKCERFVGLFEIVHQMHIFLLLKFALQSNKVRSGYSEIDYCLFCANKITWPKRYQTKRITKSKTQSSTNTWNSQNGR